ncbi:hypothetical protein SLS57_004671 [Botryosphaeria dothidea]
MSQSAEHSQWSQQLDNMAVQQDFDNLLDFGDIDLDIPFYDTNHSQSGDHQLSALADSLDSQHLPSSGVVQPLNHQNDASQSQQQPPLHSPNNMQDPGNDFFDFTFPNAYSHSHSHQPGHHQQSFSAPQDHSMQPRAFVPPTPNSVEMHGDTARYLNHLDPQSRAILEQRYQLRKEDAANFTPLGTPAVTPHESSFQVQPEFTVPGAYFSPLTSPALDAQNNRGAQQAYFSQTHTADTSMTTSPIDLDVDMMGEQAQQQESARKLRNKKSGASTRSSGPSSRIRQSPIVKPQSQSNRRKGTLSSVIPPKEVSELLEQAQQSGVIHDDQSTPRLPARKTPKLGPLSTPSGSVLPSATISPSISAVASPSSTTSTKKPELKPAGRAGKKRGSVGSALVSPALRPKISPSIKPLLPEGATTSDDTHALLLASKSNYQHLLEGTHVPGVVYPEALSTNLTSKRTSHKIAEQGRRNRINLALQELQSLIPSPTIKAKDPFANGTPANSASPEESQQKKEDKQSGSKASTVENAIEYIKLLKQKDEERDREMLRQRKEIEELRKRLEGGSIDMAKNGTAEVGEKDVSKTDDAKDSAPRSASGELMEVEAGVEVVKEKPADQEAVK